MKSRHKRAGLIRIFLGLAILLTGAILAAKHLVPLQTFGILFGFGFLVYLWGCVRFAKSGGHSFAQGFFAAFIPLALLLMPDKTKMSKTEREEYDQSEREDAEMERARRARMRAPLKGPKKAVAWLLGLFFLVLGGLIVVGYQLYWLRVVVPERESLAAAISITADKPDSQNDGKLVHVTGPLAGAENLTDPDFGVATNALRLRRRVWMYQWMEHGRKGQVGYGVEDSQGNTTTSGNYNIYSYSRDWSEKVIDSRAFHNFGHDNPSDKKSPTVR